MIRKPILSIIVPFFNAKNTLLKCLNSILQSCKGIPTEIICVDDGSTDGGKEILKNVHPGKFCKIILLIHEKNRGLYQARLTALNYVRGKFIGFVDSDDYVDEPYFRELYKIMKQSRADVAVGRIVNVSQDGVKYRQTRCLDFPYEKSEMEINGNTTTPPEQTKQTTEYDRYWTQAGACYPWHVLWNKLYRSELWTKRLDLLIKLNLHITMMEDFVYSSIVLSNAQIFRNGTAGAYYYVQSSNSSIANAADCKKWEKNIMDMGTAFSQVENILNSESSLSQYTDSCEKWKKRYSRYWYRNIQNSALTEEEKVKLKNLLKQALQVDGLEMPSVSDEYFYEEAEFL